ncbi:MAG: acetylornithine transaminase [Desulfobacterales bacterium]|nr:acetylornithine transaminase [Desulfobacterales bacterium]
MDQNIIERADRVIAHTYARHPLVLVRGKGCTVEDAEGGTYTDFVGGIAVCCLGHAHPRIARALARQAETLVHVSNLFYTVPQSELAEWLTQRSFADRVFFCNSGAEANEAAIKLVRKYFRQKQDKRFRIIAMERSFHGRTMATLSATGQEKIRKGYDPLLEGFDFAPFGDLDALKQKIGPETAAVLLEPIQGEGGVRTPPTGYLEKVRQLCDEKGILLIFDEIQTGMGRTGKLFAYEHFGIAPDIMTLAKALGNGVPIGAMLARQQVAEAFSPGAHASTFGGTPLATAAALETVRTLEEENIVARCADVGAYFKSLLTTLKERRKLVTDVRGMGLLLAMELSVEGAPVVDACMKKGFLINCIQERVLRFVPPLIISREEIDALINCLDDVLGR